MFWQELVQRFDAMHRMPGAQDEHAKPWIIPEDIFSSCPLVNEKNFETFKNAMPPKASHLDFKLSSDLASTITSLSEKVQETNIDDLIKLQSTVTDCSSLEVMSPQEHIQMLSNVDRKSYKVAYPESKIEQQRLAAKVQDFWTFLVSLQLHRQLQQPQPLLELQEQSDGFVAVPFLYDQMMRGDEMEFRPNTMGENVLEIMLERLSKQHELEISQLVLQLEKNLGVFVRNPEIVRSLAQCKTMSLAQVSIMKNAQDIAKRLCRNDDTQHFNLVVRGLLTLTILTGDIQYVLESVKICSQAAREAEFQVGDLLALMLVLGKKCYEITPAMSAFADLDPESLQSHVVGEKSLSVFDLPASDLIWNGSKIFAVRHAEQKMQLVKYEGDPKSKNFGHELQSVDVPNLADEPFMISANEASINVFAPTTGTGQPYNKVFYFDALHDCFDPLMTFANFEVLAKGFVLLDIGFSVQTHDEGGKAVAWVIYGDRELYPANKGKMLQISIEESDASWEESMNYLGSLIQFTGSRFFRHCVSNLKYDNNKKIMVYWTWEDVEFQETNNELKFIICYAWADAVSKINEYCNKLKDRKIECVRIISERGDNTVNSIVTSSAPGEKEGFFDLGYEQMAGTYDSIVQKVTSKRKDAFKDSFVSFSLCQRDINRNDNKCTITATFRPSSAFETKCKPLCKVFYNDTLHEAILAQMEFVNQEVLSKDYSLVDIGFTVQAREEGGRAVAWIVYGDKAYYPANPGKELMFEIQRSQETTSRCFDWLELKVKEAGNRFFKHCFSMTNHSVRDDVTCAVWFWNDVPFNEETDIALQWFNDGSWAGAFSKVTNGCTELTGRQLLDVKIAVHNNGQCHPSIVHQKSRSKSKFVFNLGQVNLAGTFDEILTKFTGNLAFNPNPNLVGLAMCPRDMDHNDTKWTIFASCEEQPLEKLTFSTETLKLQTRTPFKQPNQADKVVGVQSQTVDAIIFQSGSEFKFEHANKCCALENPLHKKDKLIAANLTSFKLLLQFHKHLIQYSVDDIEEAGSHSRLCKPENVMVLNERVTKLLLKCGSQDLMYIDAKVPNQVTVFHESVDMQQSFVDEMKAGQPTKQLQDYVAELHKAFKTILGYKKMTNKQGHLLFKSLYLNKPVELDTTIKMASLLPVVSCKIAGAELGGLLLDTLCHFHSLQQNQKTSLELAPMLLLCSPLTINQSPSVLSLLLELVSDFEGLNVTSQLRALKLFINHLLGLRQNGRTLDDVLSSDHKAAVQLFQALVRIEAKVAGLEQGQFKDEAQKVLKDTTNRYLALMQEHFCHANPTQKPQEFPVLLPICNSLKNENQMYFNYDLPQPFISQATQPIKLIQVKYYNNECDFHSIQFVLFNGVEKFQTKLFGNNTNLTTYDIKNDRKWSRSIWYLRDNQRFPFSQMNFKFDGVVQGLSKSAMSSTIETIEEELAENEFISGFQGYIDSCGIVRSISMKASMNQKFKSVPAVFNLSKTQLDQVTFSSPTQREQLVSKLITARLPFSLTTSDQPADEFDKEMLQFICDNFAAVPGSQEFKLATDFLIQISAMATKTENAVQQKTIHQLCRIAFDALIENVNLFTQTTVLSFALDVCANVLLLSNCGTLSHQTARLLHHFTNQQVDTERNNTLASMGFFKLMASQVCSKVRELLTTKPTVLAEDQQNENTKLLEILNQSDLFSGGFPRMHKHYCSEKTLKDVEELQQFADVKLVEETCNEQTEENKICLAIINQGQNAQIDDVIKALQLLILQLPQTRMIAQQQGELGLRLTRSAFAVLVRFAGHLHSFDHLLDEIDMELEFSVDDSQADRHQAIAKHIQEDKKLGQHLIKMWTDATKMRVWLQQQKAVIAAKVSAQFPMQEVQLTEEEQFGLSKEDILAAEQQKSNEEEAKVNSLREEAMQNRLTEIEAAIQEKARFLIKLDCPEQFKSTTCNLDDELLKLEHKSKSSHQHRKAHLELDLSAETTHTKSPQEAFSSLNENINHQEKLAEMRKAGTTSVIACLQSDISATQIQERVETNFLNAARRLAGLCLLNKFIKFVTSLSQASKMNSLVSDAMYSLCSSLQTSNDKLFHYLDGVSGCGIRMETQLRVTFFEILDSLLRYQSTQPEFNLQMIPCLQWDYKARDFKYLLKLHVLKRLMWGADNLGIQAHLAKSKELNWAVVDPVVKEHLLSPQNPKSKGLFYTFIDTMMQLISRLAEESNEQSSIQATNTSLTIQRAKSVVDSSEGATLIAQAFEIAFQEFNLFQNLYRVENTDFSDRKSLVEGLHQHTLGKTEDCDMDLKALDEAQQNKVKQGARKFLEESEKNRLHSLLSLIVLLTSIATSSPHTVALLGEVIRPDHVKTLLRLLIEVRTPLKIKILAILQNLSRSKIPSKVFATGINDIEIFSSSDIAFTDPLAGTLYSIALQLRNRETQSVYVQEHEGDYDYFVHLTRTIAACLAHQQQKTDSPHSKELSDAFVNIINLSEAEQDVLFHIMGANHQRFVHNDRLINVSTQQIRVVDFKTALESENLADCIICPDPTTIAPRLSTNALEVLAICLQMTSETDPKTVLLQNKILKLLCLQQNAGNLDLSQESRRGLMRYLLEKRDKEYQPQQTARYLELLCAYQEMLKFDTPLKLVTKPKWNSQDSCNVQLKDQEATIKTIMRSLTKPALTEIRKRDGQIDYKIGGMMLHEAYFGSLVKKADKETIEKEVESYRKQLTEFVECIKSDDGTMSIDQRSHALQLREKKIKSWMKKGLEKLYSETEANDINSQLNSVELSQVSDLLGPEISALRAVIDVTRPSRSFEAEDFKQSLNKSLAYNVSVQDLAEAKKLITSQQTAYDSMIFKPEVNRVLRKDFAKWDITKQLEFLEKTRMHESIEIVPINGNKLNSKRHPHQLTGMSGNGWGCDERRAPKLCLSGRDNRDKRISTKEGFWRYSCKEGHCDYDMCILCCKGEIFIEQVTKGQLQDNSVDLVQACKTLNKKLTSKLLLKMIDADKDFTSSNNTFCAQFGSEIDLATALIDIYNQSATELRNNTADCIWDCHFASETTDDEQLVCKGTNVNFHDIVSSVTFPSLQTLQFKVQCIFEGLLQSQQGKEIVSRLFSRLLRADRIKTNINQVATLWIAQLVKPPVSANNPLVIKLPELFETLLRTLGNNNEPYQVRVIIEHCQTILQVALDNPKLVSGGPLNHLLSSPLLDRCLSIANTKFNSDPTLLSLLLADMRVQQIEIFRKIEKVPQFEKTNTKLVIPGVTCDYGDILYLRIAPRTRAPYNSSPKVSCNVCKSNIECARGYYTCCMADKSCNYDCCKSCFKGKSQTLGDEKRCSEGLPLTLRTSARERSPYYGTSTVSCSLCSDVIKCKEGYYTCANDYKSCDFDCCRKCFDKPGLTGVVCEKDFEPLLRRTTSDSHNTVNCSLCKKTYNYESSTAYYYVCSVECDFQCCSNCFNGYKIIEKGLHKPIYQGVTCDKGDILTMRATPRTRGPFVNQSTVNCSLCKQTAYCNRGYFTCCHADTDCDFSCCFSCFKGKKAVLLSKITCEEGLALTLRTSARQRPEYYGTTTISCSLCYSSIKCKDGYYTCEHADREILGCNFDCCKSCYNTPVLDGVVCDKGDPLVARVAPRSRAPFDGKATVDCSLCKRTVSCSDRYFACCNADADCDFSCCSDCFRGFEINEGVMEDKMHTCVQELIKKRTLHTKDEMDTFAGKQQFLQVFCKIPKDEVTSLNCEKLLAQSKYSWPKFLQSYHEALNSQFAVDVLDTINEFLFSRNDGFSPSFFENFPAGQLEFKGDSFSTEFDQMLAQIVASKLMSFNSMHLQDKNLNNVFDTDLLNFIPLGLSKHQTCRNWKQIINSKKRFLVDKFLDQLFKQLLSKLPRDDRDRFEIYLNRFAARRYMDSGKVDTGDGDTIFSQVMRAVKKTDQNFTSWRKNEIDSRVFTANFQHEAATDAGGPYRATFDWMSDELQKGVLPMLVPTENQRNNVGEMRELFELNYAANSQKELEQFFMMGCWIGNAIRTTQPLTLDIHPSVWKRVVGIENFMLSDLKTSDLIKYKELVFIREAAAMSASEEDFSAVVDQTFTVTYGSKTIRTVEVCPGGRSKKVTIANAEEYIQLAVQALMKKDAVQMAELVRGIYHVVSRQAMHSCSWRYAQARACGNQKIDMKVLRQYTKWECSRDRKVEDGRYLEDVFWKVLEEFSEENKRLYLKFVTGKQKMSIDFGSTKDKHKVTSMGGNNATLPQSHTCFNTLDLPPYTTEEAMRKRIITAIQFCGEIDTDGRRYEY